MGQRTNLLLQIEARSGARLNKVYHLQWGHRKKLPMAFLHLLSSRYFRPEGADIFQTFKDVLNLEGLHDIDWRDWSKYDFNKLADCQDALSHCDNNNGAMVVIVKEHENEYTYPNFNVGFLLGPESLEGVSAYSHWVTTEDYMRHQPQYEEKFDDIFAHAFDALTTLSGATHIAPVLFITLESLITNAWGNPSSRARHERYVLYCGTIHDRRLHACHRQSHANRVAQNHRNDRSMAYRPTRYTLTGAYGYTVPLASQTTSLLYNLRC